MSNGEAGVARSWPHVRIGVGGADATPPKVGGAYIGPENGPATTPLAGVGSDDWGELNRLQAQARKDEEMIELQRQEIDALRVEREKLEKEMSDKDATLIRVMDDKALADHRAFKAEVEMRRAQQKRRNQRKALKQLHAAINEKNNRIRSLEKDNGYLVLANSRLEEERKGYALRLRNALGELAKYEGHADNTGGE